MNPLICPQCGFSVEIYSKVCPECGSLLPQPKPSAGLSGMRQGKAASSAPEETAAPSSLPDASRQGIYPEGGYHTRRKAPGQEIPLRRSGKNTVPSSPGKPMINWTLAALIVCILILFAAAGGYVYLKTSDAGQLILARLGYDANAEALWALGTEYLDQGYIDRSITCYEKAYELDPNREDIYQKLLLLGEAYEAGNRLNSAESLYRSLLDLQPQNITAYRLIANLLSNQNRTLELADFLKTAYQNTGDTSFSRQREEMLPATPTASLAGGKYQLDQSTHEQYKTVELISADGYDIYYLLDPRTDALLPEDGIFYQEAIHLDEGYHTIRAVALSSDLVSDELTTTYTVSAPVPLAPKLSLAPGDYETRQRVWIRYNGEDADTVVIYYTIDGQSPTSNSPIYTGDPIYLPGGRIHVKAVAVNTYGKISNEMDVEMKINISFLRYFNSKDTFEGYTILSTTKDAFVRRFGAADSETEFDSALSPQCLQMNYSWGFARFMPSTGGYILYQLETESSSMSGPRSTHVGQSETTITEKYRDMGQLNDQNGDRSIYWDVNEGYAKLYKLDGTNSRIDYVYYTDDGGSMTLSYYLQDQKCVRMGIRYAP